MDKQNLEELQYNLDSAELAAKRAARRAASVPDKALKEKVERLEKAASEAAQHVRERREVR